MLDPSEVPQRNPQGLLAGKVALVIGAGAEGVGWGNGNATCALFAREGASVYCVDRNEEAAKDTADLVAALGQKSEYAKADATSGADIKRVVQDCINKFGRIDILHNNVGGGVPGNVVDMGEEQWNQVIQRNLNVAYLPCHETVPHMVRQGGGVIINITSIAAIAYMENSMTAYAAAKMAMIAMTRNIALDYVKKGVRANCIVISSVDTAKNRHSVTTRFGADRLAEVQALRNSVRKIGRVATPWDIANAAVYLASDEANYVTGIELIVSAGDHITVVPSYPALVPPRST